MVVGKKNDQNIDWDDMNAAMGHLCIVIVYLMKKFAYQYKMYLLKIYLKELSAWILMEVAQD